MTDIVEEARALLAGLRSHPWRRDRDMVQGAGCILVAKCIDADAAGFIAASPRLLAALADECERLRAENARLREAMPSDDDIEDIASGIYADDRMTSAQLNRALKALSKVQDAREIADAIARLDAVKGGK